MAGGIQLGGVLPAIPAVHALLDAAQMPREDLVATAGLGHVLEDVELAGDVDPPLVLRLTRHAQQPRRVWEGEDFLLFAFDSFAALAFLFGDEFDQQSAPLDRAALVEHASEVERDLASEFEDVDERVAARAEGRKVGQALVADPLVCHVVQVDVGLAAHARLRQV